MSRFSTSLLFRAGLLLTTILVTIPSRLHAETNAQILEVPKPQTVSTPVVPGSTDRSQPPTQSKPDANVPSTGTNISIPTKPITGNNPPTATQQPATPAQPGVAATSQPPIESVVNLILNLKEKKVYVYRGDKLLAKYPVAIGKKGRETPTGEWQVMEKIRNPAWTSFKTGEVFAPGRENPLGSRWIGFWTDGKDMIGFHGTANVKSIGTAVSNGCVRMFNRDVKALFPLVKVGTTVKVVNE